MTDVCETRVHPDFFVSAKCERCDGMGRVWRVNPAALRHDREQRGLSLREVARRCGVSAAFLSDVERGRREWSDRLRKGYTVHLWPMLRGS
jgi:ribosome-binding protein aMBF1 (putative translation factor)